MKVKAYVPTPTYTKFLPEYVEVYATPERAVRAGEILWSRGARYLVVVELEQSRFFEKYGKEFCRRDDLRVVKVRAARP